MSDKKILLHLQLINSQFEQAINQSLNSFNQFKGSILNTSTSINAFDNTFKSLSQTIGNVNNITKTNEQALNQYANTVNNSNKSIGVSHKSLYDSKLTLDLNYLKEKKKNDLDELNSTIKSSAEIKKVKLKEVDEFARLEQKKLDEYIKNQKELAKQNSYSTTKYKIALEEIKKFYDSERQEIKRSADLKKQTLDKNFKESTKYLTDEIKEITSKYSKDVELAKSSHAEKQRILNQQKQEKASIDKFLADNEKQEKNNVNKFLVDAEKALIEKKKAFAKEVNDSMKKDMESMYRSSLALQEQEHKRKLDFAKQIKQQVTQGFNDSFSKAISNQSNQSQVNKSSQQKPITELEQQTTVLRLQNNQVQNNINALVNLKNSVKSNNEESKKYKQSIDEEINKLRQSKNAISENINELNKRKVSLQQNIDTTKLSNQVFNEHFNSLSKVKDILKQTADAGISKNSNSVNDLTNALATGTSAITSFHAALKIMAMDNQFVNTSSQYEVHLRNFNSLAQETELQLARTHEKLKGIATKEQLSGMTELAKSLQHIQSSNYSGADAFLILESSNKAAKSGLADLFKVVDAGTSILKSFNYEASKIDEINNLNAKVVQYGKITMNQLNDNIGSAILLARDAKIAYKEIAAGISTTTSLGIKPEIATTMINNFIKGIIKPSVQGQELADSLGIEMGAKAFSKGLGGVVNDIMSKTKQFGDDQETVVAKLLGDLREIKGLMALSTNEGKLYNEMLGHMTDGVDQVSLALNEQTKTFDYQKQALGDMTEALSTEFGFILQEAFTPFIKTLNEIITLFIALPSPVKTVIETLVLLSGGIISSTIAIGGLILGFKGLSIVLTSSGILASLKSIYAGIVLLGLPATLGVFGLIAGAIVALGAVIYTGVEAWKAYNTEVAAGEQWQELNDNIETAKNKVIELRELQKRAKEQGKDLSNSQKTALAHNIATAAGGEKDPVRKHALLMEGRQIGNEARLSEQSKQKAVQDKKDLEKEKQVLDFKTHEKNEAMAKNAVTNIAKYEDIVFNASHNKRQQRLREVDIEFNSMESDLKALLNSKSYSKEQKDQAQLLLSGLGKAKKDKIAIVNQEENENDRQDYIKKVNSFYDALTKKHEGYLIKARAEAAKDGVDKIEKLKIVNQRLLQLQKDYFEKASKFQKGSEENETAITKAQGYGAQIESNKKDIGKTLFDKIQAQQKQSILDQNNAFKDESNLIGRFEKINKEIDNYVKEETKKRKQLAAAQEALDKKELKDYIERYKEQQQLRKENNEQEIRNRETTYLGTLDNINETSLLNESLFKRKLINIDQYNQAYLDNIDTQIFAEKQRIEDLLLSDVDYNSKRAESIRKIKELEIEKDNQIFDNNERKKQDTLNVINTFGDAIIQASDKAGDESTQDFNKILKSVISLGTAVASGDPASLVGAFTTLVDVVGYFQQKATTAMLSYWENIERTKQSVLDLANENSKLRNSIDDNPETKKNVLNTQFLSDLENLNKKIQEQRVIFYEQVQNIYSGRASDDIKYQQELALRDSFERDIFNPLLTQSSLLLSKFAKDIEKIDSDIAKESIENQKNLLKIGHDLKESELENLEDSLNKKLALIENNFDLEEKLLIADYETKVINEEVYNARLETLRNQKNRAIKDAEKNNIDEIQKYNEKAFNEEIRLVESTLGKKRKALESDYDKQLDIIQNYEDRKKKLLDSRKETLEAKIERKNLFNQRLSALGNLAPSELRKTETDFNEGSFSANKTQIEKTNTLFDQGDINLEEKNRLLTDLYIKRYQYYTNLSKTAVGTLDKQKFSKEADEARSRAQEFILDAEDQKIESEKRIADQTLPIIEQKIKEAREAEEREIKKIEDAYKTSAGVFKTELVNATDYFVNYAKKQISTIGADLYNQVQKSIVEMEKAKKDISPSGVITSSVDQVNNIQNNKKPNESIDQYIARIKKEDAAAQQKVNVPIPAYVPSTGVQFGSIGDTELIPGRSPGSGIISTPSSQQSDYLRIKYYLDKLIKIRDFTDSNSFENYINQPLSWYEQQAKKYQIPSAFDVALYKYGGVSKANKINIFGEESPEIALNELQATTAVNKTQKMEELFKILTSPVESTDEMKGYMKMKQYIKEISNSMNQVYNNSSNSQSMSVGDINISIIAQGNESKNIQRDIQDYIQNGLRNDLKRTLTQ